MLLYARTASLCSQSFAGAVKSTHRIGIVNSFASLTQCARASLSRLVLSGEDQSSWWSICLMYEPTTTDNPSSKYCLATLMHLSRCYCRQPGAFNLSKRTYRLQCILIDPLKALRLQMLPKERAFTSAWWSAENDKLLIVSFPERIQRVCLRQRWLEELFGLKWMIVGFRWQTKEELLGSLKFDANVRSKISVRCCVILLALIGFLSTSSITYVKGALDIDFIIRRRAQHFRQFLPHASPWLTILVTLRGCA